MKNPDPAMYIRWLKAYEPFSGLFPGFEYKIVEIAPGFDLGTTAYTVLNHFGQEITVTKKNSVLSNIPSSAEMIPLEESFIFLEGI